MGLFGALNDFVQTGIALSPLILGQLLYPPLSYVQSLEGTSQLMATLYKQYPVKYFRFSFIYKYMLRANDWNQESPLAWVTHMFIHGSYSHLINNLSGMWTASIPIYKHLGGWAVYVAFFGGGIFAALPSSLQSAQLLRRGREVDRSIDGLTKGSTLGSIAKPFLSSGAKLFQMTTDINLSCGSSGAVCSLWGLSTVLVVDEVIWLMRENSIEAPRSKISALKALTLTDNLFSIVSFAAYMISEAGDVFGTSDVGFIEAVFGGNGQKIGHAAHLQGALFGTVLGLIIVMGRRKDKVSRMNARVRLLKL